MCVHECVTMFALPVLLFPSKTTILCVTLSVGSMVTWRSPLSCTPPVTPILWSGKEDCTGPAISQTRNCIGLQGVKWEIVLGCRELN